MQKALKTGRKLGQWTMGGIAGYLAVSLGCAPVPDVCTKKCGDAGAPGDDASGGKSSGGERASADGGMHSSAGAGSGGHASTGSDRNVGGEGGADLGTGGMNMGGEPAVLVPSLEVEFEVPSFLRLVQGSSVHFAVSVVRGGGFDGPVSLSLSGLPEGISSNSQVLLKGETEADMGLLAQSESEMGGPFEVELLATSFDGELVASGTFSLLVAGQPGAVDTSFADGGILLAGMKEVLDLEKSPSGTVFLAGNTPATLRQLGADDWADSATFTPPKTLSTRFSALAVDDAKVWLGVGNGESGDPYGVARLTHLGAKDASFGDGGFAPTAEVFSLAPRPGSDAWMVVARANQGSSGYKDVQALDKTGAVGATLAFSDKQFSLLVDGQDRLWVARVCNCTMGLDSYLDRILPNGAFDATFTSRSTSSSTDGLLSPYDARRTLLSDRYSIRLYNEDGTRLTSFATDGTLEFTTGDRPTVIDVVAQSTGRIVVLETPDGRTDTEAPASVLLLDELGATVRAFSTDGVLELNAEAPYLHSASERLFPRKVIIDEEFGRALVAVEVIRTGETEPVDVALVRIWL